LVKKYFTVFKIICACLLLVFLWGLVRFGFSPRALLANASLAAEALKSKYGYYFSYLTGKEKCEMFQYLWYKVDFDSTGVVVHDARKAYEGLTLYSNYDTKAFLVNMEGRVVHEWSKPFAKVWPDPRHIRDTVPPQFIYWRHVKVFPNGDLIAIYEGLNQSPYGGGIIKLDKDSNLLWKVSINAHHDFDMDEDGNIYVLEQKYEYVPELKLALTSDGIAVISPRGELIGIKNLLQGFYNSKYREVIPWHDADPFHTNNIEILKRDLAGRFPMFKEGDILLSMRTPSALFVVDGKTFEPKWCMRDKTVQQHDPDFMQNGAIRIFDNLGNYNTGGGRTRIIDIDPSDGRILWRYAGTSEHVFQSELRGSQQTLPNGNILITDSDRGSIFEITQEGEIVWEFRDPSLDHDKNIGVVNWATRYNKEYLAFLTNEDKEPEK
jgi:hypothetical protein